MINQQILDLLAELEKIRENGNPRWNIDHASGLFLNSLLKSMKATKVLEIGTSNGYSGIWLAEALSHNNGTLHTIESNNGRFHEAQENFIKSGLSQHIIQIKGHAPEDIVDIEGPFDMMFFDATKAEHNSYLKTLKPKLRQYGIIVTDNIESHQEELSDFSKAIHTDPDFQNTTIKIGSGLLLSVLCG